MVGPCFRCPSLVGNGSWNTDAQGYFNAGYLGYQFIGYSSIIHHQATNAYTLSGATFTGPYWETMIPMRGLILRDFSCVPDSSPATAFFWTANHVHSNAASQPLRGRLTLR